MYNSTQTGCYSTKILYATLCYFNVKIIQLYTLGIACIQTLYIILRTYDNNDLSFFDFIYQQDIVFL